MTTTAWESPGAGLGRLSPNEDDVAWRLFDARRERRLLDPSDFVRRVPDLASAYRVQRRLAELVGEPIAGLAVTPAHDSWMALGATEPTYGAVAAGAVRRSGCVLSLRSLVSPQVSIGVAIRFARDLDLASDWADARASAFVAPALQVRDSRFAASAALPKELACAAACDGGYIVYGPARPAAERRDGPSAEAAAPGRARDTTWLRCDGEPVAMSGGVAAGDPVLGQGAESFAGPWQAVRWLAATLAAQGRGPIPAGTWVFAGAPGPRAALRPGSWCARVGTEGVLLAVDA